MPQQGHIDLSNLRKAFVVHGLLIALISAAPLLAIGGAWLSPQLIVLAAAIMVALLPNAPEADVRRSTAVFAPLLPSALLPAAWMLLQIMPVPLGSIEHPIWRSTAAALPEPISGHISIDLGLTLRSLFVYLSLGALAFCAAVIARKRERAEALLFALCATTTLVALALMLLPHAATVESMDHLVALVAFGTILDAALVVRAFERYETHRPRQARSPRSHAAMLFMSVAGVVACVAALVQWATYGVLIATAFGLAAFSLMVLIRRLNLSRWTAVAVSAAVFVACCSVIALQLSANAPVSPLFRFTRPQPADAGAATLRMLADTGWAGVGVGNYAALAGIYRDATGIPDQAPINTIALMIIEWGYIGVLVVAALLLQQLIVLVRGALSRGRDSFFAAGAAACLVTTACETYCDASVTATTVQVLAAVIIGLGLSQTIGSRAG